MRISQIINILTRRHRMALLPVTVVVAVIVASCASMGRPEGGPKDELPPVFLTADPLPGELNVRSTKYRLRFDENIQLKDIQKNVIVSPAQKRQPTITGNGRVITVELRDSLRDSTTYTIDFGDAIADLNEGNILDGFAYAFSTGPVIDSLAISGMVFEAANLEPAQGMLVGAYRADAPDSAITTMPLERVTRTNQYGQFTLRNLAPGAYRLYALGDMNSDYHWDRSENVAFLAEAITPTAEPTIVTDTLKDASGADSIVSGPATLFLPNDVILTWFNENYKASYIVTNERRSRDELSLIFNAPQDSLPDLRIVAPEGPLARLAGRPLEEWGVLEASDHGDTLNVWIVDSAVMRTDSLMISARYLKTDTADRLTMTTDTIKMFVSRQMVKAEADAERRLAKAIEKATEEADSALMAKLTAPEPEPEISITIGNVQQLNRPLDIRLTDPARPFEAISALLEVMPEGDSVWAAVPGFTIRPADPLKPLRLVGSDVDWLSGASYRLTVDSAAITGARGERFKKFTGEFKARKRDEYSSIILSITGTDGRPAVAELLKKDDTPAARVAVGADGKATFGFLEPDTYYARLFFDDNGNGVYDTGSLLDSIQPEEVVYFPKKIPLKKNWDLEQTWNIYETPLDQQKPNDIKKNKPKKKDGESESDDGEEEMEYDEFGRPLNGGYRNPFGNTGSGSGSGRGGNTGRGSGLGSGGFRNNVRGGMNQIR